MNFKKILRAFIGANRNAINDFRFPTCFTFQSGCRVSDRVSSIISNKE